MFKRHNIKGELWEIKIVYFVFLISLVVLRTRSRGLFLENNIIYASVVCSAETPVLNLLIDVGRRELIETL